MKSFLMFFFLNAEPLWSAVPRWSTCRSDPHFKNVARALPPKEHDLRRRTGRRCCSFRLRFDNMELSSFDVVHLPAAQCIAKRVSRAHTLLPPPATRSWKRNVGGINVSVRVRPPCGHALSLVDRYVDVSYEVWWDAPSPFAYCEYEYSSALLAIFPNFVGSFPRINILFSPFGRVCIPPLLPDSVKNI